MARTIAVASTNFTKRDMLNSRAGVPLKDFEESITINNVISAAVLSDVDEDTSEIKDVGVIVTADKTYYTTISATIIDTMEDLIDILNEEGNVDIRVNKRLSNNKREFLTMVIL